MTNRIDGKRFLKDHCEQMIELLRDGNDAVQCVHQTVPGKDIGHGSMVVVTCHAVKLDLAGHP